MIDNPSPVDATKGFGFLTPVGEGDDVFVHHLALLDGLESLHPEQRVAFDIVPGVKRPMAENVRAER